jgi:hypothetical protein
MLACLGRTLASGDEASAQEALTIFIEVAEAHPRFLRKQLGEVVQAMLQVGRPAQAGMSCSSFAALQQLRHGASLQASSSPVPALGMRPSHRA